MGVNLTTCPVIVRAAVPLEVAFLALRGTSAAFSGAMGFPEGTMNNPKFRPLNAGGPVAARPALPSDQQSPIAQFLGTENFSIKNANDLPCFERFCRSSRRSRRGGFTNADF